VFLLNILCSVCLLWNTSFISLRNLEPAIIWVVPDDSSLSYRFNARIGVVSVVSVFELIIISTFSHRILILWDGIVENGFISRYITKSAVYGFWYVF